jgi:hypothetical protein
MRRWPLWAAAALVTGLAALAVFRPSTSEPAGTASRSESASADQTGTLVTPLPDIAGEWSRVDDAATEQAEVSYRRSVRQQFPDLDVALALYTRPDGSRLRITALLPVAGGTSAQALHADPGGPLRGFLRGSGITGRRSVDAGDLGGAMICGTPAGTFGAACGWADDSAMALVTYEVAGLDLAGAADLTRTLRGDLEDSR